MSGYLDRLVDRSRGIAVGGLAPRRLSRFEGSEVAAHIESDTSADAADSRRATITKHEPPGPLAATLDGAPSRVRRLPASGSALASTPTETESVPASQTTSGRRQPVTHRSASTGVTATRIEEERGEEDDSPDRAMWTDRPSGRNDRPEPPDVEPDRTGIAGARPQEQPMLQRDFRPGQDAQSDWTERSDRPDSMAAADRDGRVAGHRPSRQSRKVADTDDRDARATPVIEVTIGRVDIRAVSDAPSPKRATSIAAPPLADYLRGRRGRP